MASFGTQQLNDAMMRERALEAELAAKEQSLMQAASVGQQLLRRLGELEAQRDSLRRQLEDQMEMDEAERRTRAEGGQSLDMVEKFNVVQEKWKAALEVQEALKGELKEGKMTLLVRWLVGWFVCFFSFVGGCCLGGCFILNFSFPPPSPL